MAAPREPSLLELFFVNPRRDPAVVDARADQRLRALIRHAYEHVPLYRSLWRQAGLDPGAIRCRRDLPRLPMIDKEGVVAAGDDARDMRTPTRGLVEMRTSGTSGRAIHVLRTVSEMRVTRRAILRHMWRIGMRPWRPTLTLASGWLASRRGKIIEAIAKTRHLDASTTLDEQVAALDEYKPAALVGQTGGIYLLARELLRRGRTFPLSQVAPTGATLMSGMRRTIREAFGVEPCDLYGAIELGPIAWQCDRGGYHIDADRVIVEIVDDRGQPVANGESGQVVVTSLHSWTTPFIRYRLLDIATRGSGLCGCGCRFPLLGGVQGRINDFLPTPLGDLVSPHFFFHLFDDSVRNPVKEWRIIQEDIERLVYEYVPEDVGFDPAALDRGMRRVRERFGNGCVVESRAVASLPMTPAGKRRCIVSRLRPPAASLDDAWIQPAGAAPPINGRAERSAQPT